MRRFLPDMLTILLLCTVALASVFPASGRMADDLAIVSDAAIGLLFFLHGARLSRAVVVAGFLHWRLHLTILATTFVLFPPIGLAFAFVPESILPQPLYLGILFLCLLPSTVQSSIAFTSISGGNVSAAICAASASNILGLFLTPLLVGLLFTTGGQGGISMGAVGDILLQLFAPFLLGQILQPWIGNWIRARKTLLTPVDRGAILLVVYLAFSHAVVDGIWSAFSLRDIAVVALIDCVILAAVLGLTELAGRLFGFARPDAIALVFCGSKKSLASGVPIANVLFAGQAIGPIVLPLMLFHQIQLMVCAVIAQRYAGSARANETAIAVGSEEAKLVRTSA